MSDVVSSQKTAGVIGLGLIGGSVALALRDLGYVVGGIDEDQDAVERAVADGIIER